MLQKGSISKAMSDIRKSNETTLPDHNLPLRVVFMGTPQFAVPCLEALMRHPEIARVMAVYTQPDRPAGRGQKMNSPAVKLAAIQHNLPVFQPENINKNDEPQRLADIMADVVIVVAYAQFLGSQVLNIPRFGCINVHASLLPKFRGAAPIQYALLNGETESGVTTMRLVKKMDAGPILLQKKVPLPLDMTSEDLFTLLSVRGSELLIETLKQLQLNALTEIPQDEAQATYANLLQKEMGGIDWQRTGREILNQIRALKPWPGTFMHTSRGILKVHTATLSALSPDANAKPGDVRLEKSSILVRCKDAWVSLLTLQPEGKRVLSCEEFMAGLKGETFAVIPAPHAPNDESSKTAS